MGMLRALGLPKSSVINLMVSQSFLFAVPGIVLGIILAAVMNMMAYIGIYL